MKVKTIVLRESRSSMCDFWHRIRVGLVGVALILLIAWVMK
ncbi:hypothetical protein [Neotabrizicola sp. sgz301269]